ncbi:GntR family transcriptional regulator, partial [bacterium]|nr:GntR family transcriptional regulator [bacterium]
MKHLTLEDIKIPKPDFSAKNAKKGHLISMWLIEWVSYALEYGIADIGDFIPSKETLAKYLNVSCATIQNSIRYVKNLGYFTSKQSMGTAIADIYSKDINQDELYHGTVAECRVKKIIMDTNAQIGDFLPSVKAISSTTDISQNTVRLVLSNLELKGYIEKIKDKGNKYSYIYKRELQLTEDELLCGIKEEDFTLTHQLVEKIKDYLAKTYKQGDKILSNSALARMFNVSIKTINDSMKILTAKGVILPRRGRYGTIYLEGAINSKRSYMDLGEKKQNIAQNYVYAWQKTLEHLKKYMVENFESGDKLPPIRKLA